MFFGRNPQNVFKLIFEFDELRKNYAIEDFANVKLSEIVTNYYRDLKSKYPSSDALWYLMMIRIIVVDYILIPDFNKETVFNKIHDDYNRKLTVDEARERVGLFPDPCCKPGYWIGLEDFIEYRETLEIEKNIFGYMNMMNIYFKTKSGQYKR